MVMLILSKKMTGGKYENISDIRYIVYFCCCMVCSTLSGTCTGGRYLYCAR